MPRDEGPRSSGDPARGGREVAPANPLAPFIEAQGAVILDGGLATTLEARGFDLRDPLWSARLLLDDPDAIRHVHREFLEAGADCISTVTYQASLPGLEERGLGEREGLELFDLAVRLAVEARDGFWAETANRAGRLRPLVAASIGPYGAYLADGSEYRGNYGIGRDALRRFHLPRWARLAESAVDILACETIPSAVETEVLLELLEDTPDRWAWISFSCRDEAHISDGAPLREVVGWCDAVLNVAAVGVNCVSPRLIPPLLQELASQTTKPLLAYPNSGETYDAIRKSWTTPPTGAPASPDPVGWIRSGATGVGGCCRVTPDQIRRIRAEVVP